MNGRERFINKNVVVTGAGTGIGREIALAFGAEGANVALHYSHGPEGAESAAAKIQDCGGKAACFQADFDGLDEVERFAGQAFDFLGGVDVLVNNAGITFNKPFLEVTPAQYDLIYNVNMRAQYFLTQHAARLMIEADGGAICNLASIHGIQGAPEHSVYAGTKGAIIGYTRTLGIELAHKGVRVNAIAPGWVMVENHARIFPNYSEENALESAKSSVPLGRPGYPGDIAKLALFLCSDDAAYIVGQTIVADGGTTSLMSLISDFRSRSEARCGLGYVPGV